MATIRDRMGHCLHESFTEATRASSPSPEKRELDSSEDGVPWSPGSITRPVSTTCSAVSRSRASFARKANRVRDGRSIANSERQHDERKNPVPDSTPLLSNGTEAVFRKGLSLSSLRGRMAHSVSNRCHTPILRDVIPPVAGRGDSPRARPAGRIPSSPGREGGGRDGRSGRPAPYLPPPATGPSQDHRDARTGVMALIPAPARGNSPTFPTNSPGANRYARARPSAAATTSSTWAGQAYP